MDPIVLFFGFGVLAGLLRCHIKYSPSVSELLTMLLLVTIGLKGGMELYGRNLFELVPQILAVASLGLVIPLVAYPIARNIGGFNRVDAAALASHYGSVSVGTFAVCIGFLKAKNISFEAYVPLFVIVLEIPAIIVGLIIAKRKSQFSRISSLFKETLRSRAVVFLIGGLLVGWLAGAERLTSYNRLFVELFYGVLALFLVEMGYLVSEQLPEVRRHGWFLLVFGIAMPIFSGLLALGLSYALGLSLGGAVVVTVLGASASYIAVPAAMRVSLPEANLGLSLGSSLGITFPFNVLIGIPLFFQIARALYGEA